jgi:hypothetical protein
MGLSEQERRIFDEIEQNLTEQDPRFVSKARRSTVEGRRGRRLRMAFAALVLGFLLLLGLVISQWFGFVGFGLMFAGVVLGAHELQGVDGDLSQRVRALLARQGDDG